jgi:hypothetical protein
MAQAYTFCELREDAGHCVHFRCNNLYYFASYVCEQLCEQLQLRIGVRKVCKSRHSGTQAADIGACVATAAAAAAGGGMLRLVLTS